MKRTMSLDEFKDFCGNVEKAIFSTEWNKKNIKRSSIDLYSVFDEVYITPQENSVTFSGIAGDITIHNVREVSITQLPFNDVLADIFIDGMSGKRICVILVMEQK